MAIAYLEPEFHTLQLGVTAIKAGTKQTMMPTVKVLALKILPCLLRCFPNVERLHIMSKKTADGTSKLSLQFREQSGVVESIRSNVKVVIYHNFRGAQCELCFLEFLLKNAGVLSNLVIAYDKDAFASLTEVESVVEPVLDVIWATSCCSLVLVERVFTEGEGLKMLNIVKRGSNVSITDPFDFTG